MESYSALTKEKQNDDICREMGPMEENFILSEVTQAQEDIHHMFPLVCGSELQTNLSGYLGIAEGTRKLGIGHG